MKRYLSVLFAGMVFSSFCQQSSDSCKSPFIYPVQGLVHYYFWESDSSGVISPQTFTHHLISNTVLRFSLFSSQKHPVSLRDMLKFVKQQLSYHAQPSDTETQLETAFGSRVKVAYSRCFVAEPMSVLVIKHRNYWETKVVNRILHFKISQNGDRVWDGATDSFPFSSNNNNLKNAYYVYHSADSSDFSTRVFTYAGEEITELFTQQCLLSAHRYLLFINGYRGPKNEKKESSGLITTYDKYNYWYGIDDCFADRLQAQNLFYLDAHFSVRTSNHYSRAGFAWSYLRSTAFAGRKNSERSYRKLNLRPNTEGFRYRKEKGKIAGTVFLAAIENTTDKNVKDTIDLVCHSMGYAYMLGFLEVTASRCVLGKCYIIAPENAGAEGYEWIRFQEVWQYGSNLEKGQRDPLKQQDGIAPQTAVKNLEQLSDKQGGRVFFPPNASGRNFIDSHMVYSYEWMFEIALGQKGYIQR